MTRKANITVIGHRHDFGAVHAAMQRYVDQEILAGVSSAVLVGRDLVDVHCVGWADREAEVPLQADHIFRIFSNTKLATACAALMLYEEGAFELDDPIERYIPQLGERQVLRSGATDPSDTVPAVGPITIRHLMTHSSGLSYGLLDPGTLIFKLYTSHKVYAPVTPLPEMIEALAELPLVFHPGESWEYSIGMDVIARLLEIVSGQPFDALLKERVLDPLGMIDTDYLVPPKKRHRFTAYYDGADPADQMQAGLTRLHDAPYPNAFLQSFPRRGGGTGLVSTLPDMVALLRSLMPGGQTLLRPETIGLITTNLLPEGVYVRFPMTGVLPGRGHSAAGAVIVSPLPNERPEVLGEVNWGGQAGTHWWFHPTYKLAGVLMTQRQMSFWHPYIDELKRLICEAVMV